MSDKQYKLIRKQLRNVVQEQLKDTFAKEIKDQVKTEVATDVAKWMLTINDQVKETLSQIDKRSKDIQSYVVRNAAGSQTAPDGAVDVKNASEGDKA